MNKTHLDKLVPDSSIDLTLTGQYDKLYDHIQVHRYYMGEQLDRPIEDDEAVLGWYRDVYLPLADAITEHDLLSDFPSRTITDLYLWVIEHMWYLREQQNDEVTPAEAADHFSRSYSKNPIRRIQNLMDSLAILVEDVDKSSQTDTADADEPSEE